MVSNGNAIRRKQVRIQLLIKDQFGTISAFAISKNLNYNRLIGTISGRDPDSACVREILASFFELKAEDLPRLPKRWSESSGDGQ